MDFNYTKIKLGNWLFKNCFPAYNFIYSRFKRKNDFHEINILKEVVKPGYFVLDIGGNIGFYAKTLSQMVGVNGQVYSFEPDVTNFKHLQKNTRALKNIRLFNCAVSDKHETLKIYTSKLLNVDHRTYPVHNYDTVNEISAVSIDQLISENSIAKADFIKIDIQGYELAAFKGMQNLLQSTPHLKIVAEYWPHGFKRAGTSAIEFFQFFDNLGYQFSIIDHNSRISVTEQFITEHNDEPFEFSFNVLIEKKTIPA